MKRDWRLICYDVRDPKRLRRVAQTLKGYGDRLQYSVFCCYLSEQETERARFELRSIMESEDDLLIIPICARCVEKIRATHFRKVWPDEPDQYTIIGS